MSVSTDPLVDELLEKFDLSAARATTLEELALVRGRREVVEYIARRGLPEGTTASFKEVIKVYVPTKDPKDSRPHRTGRAPQAGRGQRPSLPG